MSSDQPAKPAGLSLYANLLDPSSESAPGTTISSAPVLYKQPSNGNAASANDEAAAPKQSINAAALRFQPTRRPQIAAHKGKSTPAKVSQPPQPPTLAANESRNPVSAKAAEKDARGDASLAPSQPKTSIADWTADGDEDDYYLGNNQRQRGGRKRRKKNKERAPAAQDWDDIYDPTRPNSYEEYKQSDERMRELRDWKDLLYAHRMSHRRSIDSDSEEEERRPAMQFAPPPASFAPPPLPPPPREKPEDYLPRPPPSETPRDNTGEDAYARRLRMSQQAQGGTAIPSPPIPIATHATFTPTSSISRAPVRYSLPAAPAELPATDAELESVLQQEKDEPAPNAPGEEAPRSLRPGQKGFAERLMAKYGWTKGTGLGTNASGIVTPLQAKLDKRKQRPDSEGGGFIGPGGMGKIVGGKKKGGEEASPYGPMSEVVILKGMVDGMDLQYELGEGNLMQEIGEECGEKYGRVERVYINQGDTGSPPVFIKFTSQLSALRAVNALEGRIFNGNTIIARFFDSDKFDRAIYN